MRKSLDDIRSIIESPAAGVALMLLVIAAFLVFLWVVIVAVRVVMG